jgi:hypothetical protein
MRGKAGGGRGIRFAIVAVVTRRACTGRLVLSLAALFSVACAAGVTAPEEETSDGAAGAVMTTAGRGGQSGFSVAGASNARAGTAGSSATTNGASGGGGAATSAGQAGNANGGMPDAGAASGGTSGGASAGSGAVGCAEQHFEYSSGGKTLQSVHLSGTFNAWSDPGTPLVRDLAGDAWKLSMQLAAGSYEYKFVLDGTIWISDPANPNTQNDTFGGVNSVLTVVCP